MLCLLIISLPLFNIIYYILFSNYFGILYVYYSVSVGFFLTIFAFITLFNVLNHHYLYYIKIFDWVDYLDFFVPLDLVFDELSVVMLVVVIFIAFFVQSFSKWYMSGDPYYFKFFYFLNFFIFFMLLLVLSNNVIFIFIGWEGIGIFSYLLINFWSTRLEANRSALKAIILNKIGDCFFYFFIVLFYFVFENFNIYLSKNLFSNYLYLNFVIFNFNVNVFFMLSLLLLFAAAAKSAQLFLHVWLPDAMEGPTPVSALLHAATMVTAGVYLLLKFSWIIQSNFFLLSIFILLGIFTNLFASLTAIFQSDIKKIIAYSTASQLGLIFIAFGLSKFSLALFHIFTHAFFKALLFLLAGIIIHFSINKQDLRYLKNFNQFNIFLLYIGFLIASLTLTTIPFFSAYYSKDFFVQLSLINVYYFNYFSFFFLNISIFTSSVYSFKILEYIFWNKKLFNFNSILFNNVYYYFFISIYILLFFSMLVGYFMFNIFKFDYLIFSDVFFYNLNLNCSNVLVYFEYSNVFILTLTISGFIFGYYLHNFFNFFNMVLNNFANKIYFFFNKKFLFDNIYYFFFKLFYKFLIIFFLVVDRSIIEYSLTSILYVIKKNSLKINFLENFLNVFIFFIFGLFLAWNYFFLIYLVLLFLKYFVC